MLFGTAGILHCTKIFPPLSSSTGFYSFPLWWQALWNNHLLWWAGHEDLIKDFGLRRSSREEQPQMNIKCHQSGGLRGHLTLGMLPSALSMWDAYFDSKLISVGTGARTNQNPLVTVSVSGTSPFSECQSRGGPDGKLKHSSWNLLSFWCLLFSSWMDALVLLLSMLHAARRKMRCVIVTDLCFCAPVPSPLCADWCSVKHCGEDA